MALALVVGGVVAIVPIPTLNSITGYLFDLIVNEAKVNGVQIIATRPGEAFFTYLQVALVVGATLAMPVIIYQVLAFVSPALYANEKRYLYIAVPGVFFSFLVGVAFCYYLTLPFATHFLAGFLAGTIEPLLVGRTLRRLCRQLPVLGRRDVRVTDRHVLLEQARRGQPPAHGEVQEVRVRHGVRHWRGDHANARPDQSDDHQLANLLPVRAGSHPREVRMTLTSGAITAPPSGPKLRRRQVCSAAS